MNITEQKTDYGTILLFDGKIDKITSNQVQTAILNAVQRSSDLTLDFSKVQYISSAGLRALLLGQKSAAAKGGTMKLINVGEEVMGVLKISGFEKILTIR